MATLYQVAVRMCCAECGEAVALGLAWARRPIAFVCSGCGATIAPGTVEVRREILRVEEEWLWLWEDLQRQAAREP